MDEQIESFLQGSKFKKLLEEENIELRQKYNLKKAELEILYFLSHCEGHNTSTDIHYQLMMNRGHISQAVDSLCRRNFIVALPDKEDRRYVHYELLDSAREIVKEMSGKREEMNRRILDAYCEAERPGLRSKTAAFRF